MNENQSIALGVYFFLGIVLLAIIGYMYDSLQKGVAKEDESSSIFSMQKKLIMVFYVAPVRFIYQSIKKKDLKGIIISILGYDSWIMINLNSQRAANTDDIDPE